MCFVFGLGYLSLFPRLSVALLFKWKEWLCSSVCASIIVVPSPMSRRRQRRRYHLYLHIISILFNCYYHNQWYSNPAIFAKCLLQMCHVWEKWNDSSEIYYLCTVSSQENRLPRPVIIVQNPWFIHLSSFSRIPVLKREKEARENLLSLQYRPQFLIFASSSTFYVTVREHRIIVLSRFIKRKITFPVF